MNPFYNSPKLLHLLDKNGNSNSNDPRFIECKLQAEEITKRLLGCTIGINDRAFILTSLELYYGSLGDTAHDWYRGQFKIKKKDSKIKKDSLVQRQDGLRIYLSKFGSPNYCRFDLAFGPEGVAVSALVRNVFDIKKRVFLGAEPYGQPAVVMIEMDLKKEYHSRKLEEIGDLTFQDTYSKYIKEDAKNISTSKRIVDGNAVGLGDAPFKDYLWNFTLRNCKEISARS